MHMKYPWRTKQFYPVKWPAQAIHRQKGRVVLPMGKGRPSLVLSLDLPDNSGACTLAEMLPLGRGQPGDTVQKPIPF
jgi:putative transposase